MLGTAIDRRQLLRATGVSAGTLFLPSLIGDKKANAQGAPKRLVIFRTSQGPVTGRWEMRRPGLPDNGADWEFPLDDPDPMSFTESLRPLHAVRNDLLLLEGLAFGSMMPNLIDNGHNMSGGHLLTGGSGPSVDQLIAQRIRVPGRIDYLYTNTGSCDGCLGQSIVRDVTGQPVGGVMVGSTVRRILDILPNAGASPAPHLPRTPLELSRARRQSTLDFLRGQYSAILPRVGIDDRAKLMRHRDMLADLAQRTASLQNVSCEKPSNTTGSVDNFLTNLLPLAMGCDLTRVSVFHHMDFDNPPAALGAPGSMTDYHNDIAHPGKDGHPAAQWMIKAYNLHSRQFANMIAAFKEVPEGNGTMLDNSLLVWMPELANGQHDFYKLMFVVAGGSNLGFRTGRYLKYDEPNQTSGTSFRFGPAHNKLLVSIVQAFGLDRNSVGMTTAPAGRFLPKSIDLTGPLPRLT